MAVRLKHDNPLERLFMNEPSREGAPSFGERHRRLGPVFVAAFQRRWSKILRQSLKGRTSPADKLWRCFEADTKARQHSLALRFYGVKHARRMAKLTERQILNMTSCYLPAAIRFAMSDASSEEPASLIKALAASEYVLFQGNPYSDVIHGCDQEPGDDWSVREWPSNAIYDDWFELTFGGVGSGGTFVLAKSTGEPFTQREREWLRASFVGNIDACVSNETGNEILWGAYIYDFGPRLVGLRAREAPNRSVYISEVLTVVSRLKRSDISLLLDCVNKELSNWSKASGDLAERRLGTSADSGKAVAATLAALISGMTEDSNDFVRRIERAVNVVLGSGREIEHVV